MPFEPFDVREIAPRVLPVSWCSLSTPGFPEIQRFLHESGLRVILGHGRELDGKHWLHVSMSRVARMPTYEDMAMAKAVFIGAGRTALQVFPPESKHVNIHNFCLHLWCCLDGDVTPDFTRGNGMI